MVDKNKFLTVRRGVRLNEIIEPVIVALDKYFEAANLKAVVTSGERTSEDQLSIIKNYASRYGVDEEYPELIDCQVLDKIDVDGQELFAWQRGWSRLLNKNVIINPPVPANCLFDYFRGGVNRKGSMIGYSPHYYGKAFDIGGIKNDGNVTNEMQVIQKAMADKLPGLKGYLLERANNCLHVDCQAVATGLTANV